MTVKNPDDFIVITNFDAFTICSNGSPFKFHDAAPAELDIHLRCSYAEAMDIAKEAVRDGIEAVKVTPLSSDAENLDMPTMFSLDFYGDAAYSKSVSRIVTFLRDKDLLKKDETDHYENMNIIVKTRSDLFSSGEMSMQFVKLSTYMDIFNGKIL